MAKEKEKGKDNEKVYTIPLRDAWKGPCKKRAKKCLYVIREFVKRHMKTEKVKVGTALNHEIWCRGIKNPPRKLKVQVVPHEDAVWVELQGVKLELKKKEEKKKETAEKTKEESKEKPVEKGDAKKKGAQAVSEKKEEVGEEKKEAEAKPASKKEAPEKKEAKKKEAPDSGKKQDPSEKLPPKAKLH
ncbi:MAG: 60S ribosomal protein L31 [Candidatus Aenigmarchaeota archaeon]|nr:60S ribosomal protein L31 [Candidatus Aenigmarchaeota archaeon]